MFATEALTGPSPSVDIHLVGPSLGGSRGGDKVDLQFAAGRPLVYATFGTQAYHQPARFDKLFEAAAASDIAIVYAMGPLAKEYEDSRWVRCVNTVDQLALLPRCAVVLHHGGANTVMEACAFGVPQIIAPIYNDQPHNARLVARAGCGVAIDLEGSPTLELVGALDRLFGEGDERSFGARDRDQLHRAPRLTCRRRSRRTRETLTGSPLAISQAVFAEAYKPIRMHAAADLSGSSGGI